MSNKTNNTISIYSSVFAGLLGGILAFSSLFFVGGNYTSSFDFFNNTDKSTQIEQRSIGTCESNRCVTLEEATIDVVDRSNPAVVNISIFKEVGSRQYQDVPPPFDQYFELRRPQQPTPQEGEKIKVGGGSGFLVSSDGIIVTNKHVVSREEAEYEVQLANNKDYDAEVLAKDPIFDVALLKIDGEELPTLNLGNSDNIKIGQTVIAIGNALSEFENTVTRGIISGVGRKIQASGGRFGEVKVIDKAIQTDAAINPGNSGGPLLSLKGEVIGINTAVSEQGQSVSFAIPINQVKQTIESVKQTGKIVRPWLGVRYLQITPRVSEINQLPVDYGVLIVRGSTPEQLAVIPNSPADQAGLEEDDIILEVSGKKLNNDNQLREIIAQHEIGETIQLKILDQGEEKNIEVELEEMPSDL